MRILCLVVFLSGCATWYTDPAELAEMEARRNQPLPEHCSEDVDGELFCKDKPPEPDCVQLADYIWDCTDLIKAEVSHAYYR